VLLLIIVTMIEPCDSVTEIGLDKMLLGTIWRPGSIISVEDTQFGQVR
jgi:hypothetical protein